MRANVPHARTRRDDMVPMSSYGRVEQNRCSRVFRGTFLLPPRASRTASLRRFTSPNALDAIAAGIPRLAPRTIARRACAIRRGIRSAFTHSCGFHACDRQGRRLCASCIARCVNSIHAFARMRCNHRSMRMFMRSRMRCGSSRWRRSCATPRVRHGSGMRLAPGAVHPAQISEERNVNCEG
jgi:hypothetical protein